jgi:hypothetical protein
MVVQVTMSKQPWFGATLLPQPFTSSVSLRPACTEGGRRPPQRAHVRKAIERCVARRVLRAGDRPFRPHPRDGALSRKTILLRRPVTGLEYGHSMRLQTLFYLFGEVLLNKYERPHGVLIQIYGQHFLDLRYVQLDVHTFEIHRSCLFPLCESGNESRYPMQSTRTCTVLLILIPVLPDAPAPFRSSTSVRASTSGSRGNGLVENGCCIHAR